MAAGADLINGTNSQNGLDEEEEEEERALFNFSIPLLAPISPPHKACLSPAEKFEISSEKEGKRGVATAVTVRPPLLSCQTVWEEGNGRESVKKKMRIRKNPFSSFFSAPKNQPIFPSLHIRAKESPHRRRLNFSLLIQAISSSFVYT